LVLTKDKKGKSSEPPYFFETLPQMVFYSDIRAPAVQISLNANLCRFILEELYPDAAYSEKHIETLTMAVEYRLATQLSCGETVSLHETIIETNSNL
jgi:hypothetical protein